MSDTQTKLNRAALKASEEATWALVEAMVETYRAITGKMPSDKLREDIYYAVRLAT